MAYLHHGDYYILTYFLLRSDWMFRSLRRINDIHFRYDATISIACACYFLVSTLGWLCINEETRVGCPYGYHYGDHVLLYAA